MSPTPTAAFERPVPPFGAGIRLRALPLIPLDRPIIGLLLTGLIE